VARKYTRLEQRRYREKRRAQAARVAERLMGRKKKVTFPLDNDDVVSPLLYQPQLWNMYGKNPRSSIYMGGIST
jgi:hypothetical protein